MPPSCQISRRIARGVVRADRGERGKVWVDQVSDGDGIERHRVDDRVARLFQEGVERVLALADTEKRAVHAGNLRRGDRPGGGGGGDTLAAARAVPKRERPVGPVPRGGPCRLDRGLNGCCGGQCHEAVSGKSAASSDMACSTAGPSVPRITILEP